MEYHGIPWNTMEYHGKPTLIPCFKKTFNLSATVMSEHDRSTNWPLAMVHGQPWSENVIVNIERTCLD